MSKFIVFINAFYRAVSLVWKSNRKLALANVILQFLLAVVPLANLYIIKDLIDLVLKQDLLSYQAVLNQVLLLAGVQILNAILNQLSQYFQNVQQQSIIDFVTALVIEKAIKVPYNYYENPDYHDTLHLAQYQALYRVPTLATSINQLIQQGLNVLMLSVLFITLEWYYFFLFVVIGLPLAFVRWHYSNKTNQLEKKNVASQRQANYLNLVLTSLAYAKEVRVFDFGTTFFDKFKNIRSKIANEKKVINYQNAWAGFWAHLIEILSICYVYFKIAIQTFTGILSVGSFVMYFQAFQRLQASLRNFLESLVQLFQLRLFLNDLFLFLDIPQYEKTHTKGIAEAEQGITINNLSFAYPDTGKQVLNNIYLKCKRGTMVAIVGENGSGKSTLVKLLTGLYHVPNDAINIDGLSINKMSEMQIRNKVSVVFQDFNMYDASVTENIGLNISTSNNKILESAEASGADLFIDKLPFGYDTLLGRSFNKSEQLSGGQWQKLALSRAIYRNTKIMILDEPTSHIDPIAEYSIIENLKKNIGDKIIILITHRLYNLKNADHIFTIHEGQIIEQGTFSELILKEGVFNKMYQKQSL